MKMEAIDALSTMASVENGSRFLNDSLGYNYEENEALEAVVKIVVPVSVVM